VVGTLASSQYRDTDWGTFRLRRARRDAPAGFITLEGVDPAGVLDTWTVRTGGGGEHKFYKHPGFDVPSAAPIKDANGSALPGLDRRGDGGYVVLPPSVHLSGKPYVWKSDLDEDELLPMPAFVYSRDAATAGKAAPQVGNTIQQGARNTTLASLAGSMRRRGMSEEEIEVTLLAVNSGRCAPPLDESEVKKIARSVARYEPAASCLSAPAGGAFVRPCKPTPPGKFMRTELGNAERLVAVHGADLRWCDQRGKWLVWTGQRWSEDLERDVVRRAQGVVRSIYAEAAAEEDEEERKNLGKHAAKSETSAAHKAMLEHAKALLPVRLDELDADPWVLNVENGTIDLRTGKLRDHQREDSIVKLAPVTYDPDADAPRWRRFLDEIMDGNAELMGYLQRLFGMCLSGDVTEHVFPIFYGEGCNGKNTLLDTMLALLGDYAQKAPASLLMTRRSEEHPTEIADLFGKRLVVASETEEGKRLRVQLMKELTGDRYLKARFIRQDYFQFERIFKMILMTNNKPIVREQTVAVWRRVKLVPFNVTIPDGKQDKRLGEKLHAESPGILAWAVRGCLDWQHRGGLEEPEVVRVATGDYKAEEDPLHAWLADRTERGQVAWCKSSELWDSYETWAKENHERYPLGRRTWARHLEALGFKRKRQKVDGVVTRTWQGLDLIRACG